MKRFRVILKKVYDIEIEALNKDQAYELACDLVEEENVTSTSEISIEFLSETEQEFDTIEGDR
jgi:hypothetical protein